MSTFEWGGFTWSMFGGTGHLGQQWSEDHVLVSPATGHLVLLNAGGVSGGVALRDEHHTYGKWTVRYRMRGAGGKYAILLWPSDGTMRPEIDFAEDSLHDPTRSIVTATLHPDMDNSHNIHKVLYGSSPGEFSHFHDLAVDWQKDHLSFQCDGKEWFLVTDHIPNTPHHLCIQTAMFSAADPPSRLVVDSVTVEAA